MATRRLLLSLTLLVALLGAAAALWAVVPQGVPGDSGAFPVRVEGPGGHVVHDGTVEIAGATALTVLQAAGARGGFDVVVEEHPAYGPGCQAKYVVQIGSHRATGSAGWVYRVWSPDEDGKGGSWNYPLRSAACHGLTEGDRLEWHWTDGSGPWDD